VLAFVEPEHLSVNLYIDDQLCVEKRTEAVDRYERSSTPLQTRLKAHFGARLSPRRSGRSSWKSPTPPRRRHEPSRSSEKVSLPGD